MRWTTISETKEVNYDKYDHVGKEASTTEQRKSLLQDFIYETSLFTRGDFGEACVT